MASWKINAARSASLRKESTLASLHTTRRVGIACVVSRHLLYITFMFYAYHMFTYLHIYYFYMTLAVHVHYMNVYMYIYTACTDTYVTQTLHVSYLFITPA